MNIQKSTQATSIFEDQNIACLSSETRVYLSLRKRPHSEIVFVCGSPYIDCLMGKWILTVRLTTLHIPLPLPQRISTGKAYVNFCVLWNFNHIWTAESSTNLIAIPKSHKQRYIAGSTECSMKHISNDLSAGL
jgi:hypothetical protein